MNGLSGWGGVLDIVFRMKQADHLNPEFMAITGNMDI